MHARVITALLEPGKLDEGIQLFRQVLLPTTRQHEGFHSTLVLTDPLGNKGVAITLWETEAHLKAPEPLTFRQHITAQFEHNLSRKLDIADYEVALEEIPQGSRARYARVMIGHTQAGQLDEAVRLVGEVFVPAFKKQKGFQGLLFLVDPKTNKCLSISVWETEAEMKGHESSGQHGEQLAKGAHLMVEPHQIVEQRQYYEVAVLA